MGGTSEKHDKIAAQTAEAVVEYLEGAVRESEVKIGERIVDERIVSPEVKIAVEAQNLHLTKQVREVTKNHLKNGYNLIWAVHKNNETERNRIQREVSPILNREVTVTLVDDDVQLGTIIRPCDATWRIRSLWELGTERRCRLRIGDRVVQMWSDGERLYLQGDAGSVSNEVDLIEKIKRGAVIRLPANTNTFGTI